jgi:outer membrane protein assembly factor BamB
MLQLSPDRNSVVPAVKLCSQRERAFRSICRARSLLAGMLFSGWMVSIGLGADWPRLLGPEAKGVSPETGLSRLWPAAGPRVLWSTAVGEGFAGPAISQGQVFLLDRVPGRQDLLRCFDLGTGGELWCLTNDAPGTLPYNNGSRNVPTVDGPLVFAVGPMGQFYCVDRESHQLRWSKHLVGDFRDSRVDVAKAPGNREEQLARAQLPTWGLTQAPLVYGDAVIVAPQTQSTGLVAYEKSTGNLRWRSPYIGRNWYSHISPCLVTLCGVDQVIMLAQPSDPEKSPAEAPPAIVSSIDPWSGRVLWTTNTVAPYKIPIPQPLAVGTNRLFITGGYGLGCLMLEVSATGGEWRTRVLFQNQNVASHIQSPVLCKERIYAMSSKEHGGKGTGLVCLNLDGQIVWQTGPALQFDFGGFLIADGLAFVAHGRTGELHLYELSPSAPRPLATAKVLEAKGHNVWAPLALSDRKLLVRDQHELKCLDVGTP